MSIQIMFVKHQYKKTKIKFHFKHTEARNDIKIIYLSIK